MKTFWRLVNIILDEALLNLDALQTPAQQLLPAV